MTKARPDAQEQIMVRMFDGNRSMMRRGKIVGWCHNKIHPGAISQKLCEEHECLGKQCRYFEKNEVSFYLAALEAEKKEKEKQKEALRQKKLQQAKENSSLLAMQQRWQDYLDRTRSDMQIVRIVRESPTFCRVFYVSSRPFADGNRFPDFLEMVRKTEPRLRIQLRHIRDEDGRFVTKEEYDHRRRQ